MEVKYQEMLDLFKQNVLEVEPTAQVLLYGSRARGDANKDWHQRHSITPFYKSVQSEAILL